MVRFQTEQIFCWQCKLITLFFFFTSLLPFFQFCLKKVISLKEKKEKKKEKKKIWKSPHQFFASPKQPSLDKSRQWCSVSATTNWSTELYPLSVIISARGRQYSLQVSDCGQLVTADVCLERRSLFSAQVAGWKMRGEKMTLFQRFETSLLIRAAFRLNGCATSPQSESPVTRGCWKKK